MSTLNIDTSDLCADEVTTICATQPCVTGVALFKDTLSNAANAWIRDGLCTKEDVRSILSSSLNGQFFRKDNVIDPKSNVKPTWIDCVVFCIPMQFMPLLQARCAVCMDERKVHVVEEGSKVSVVDTSFLLY